MLATFELQNSIIVHNWYMYMYSPVTRPPPPDEAILHVVYLSVAS